MQFLYADTIVTSVLLIDQRSSIADIDVPYASAGSMSHRLLFHSLAPRPSDEAFRRPGEDYRGA
jgi:hypothetical protein